MICCYFGVPGVGKTSLLAKKGVKELRRIVKGKKRYDNVYTNFYLAGANQIDFTDLGKYKIERSLILLDELAIDADNRNFKNFDKGIRDFLTEHRHLGCDIIYATQDYAMVDLKVRQLTQELWYMSKSVVPFFSAFTSAKRIYRKVDINEHTSELTLGYRFCNLLESFFVSNYQCVLRRKYYKYFDSFDTSRFDNRPEYVSCKWSDFPPSRISLIKSRVQRLMRSIKLNMRRCVRKGARRLRLILHRATPGVVTQHSLSFWTRLKLRLECPSLKQRAKDIWRKDNKL